MFSFFLRIFFIHYHQLIADPVQGFRRRPQRQARLSRVHTRSQRYKVGKRIKNRGGIQAPKNRCPENIPGHLKWISSAEKSMPRKIPGLGMEFKRRQNVIAPRDGSRGVIMKELGDSLKIVNQNSGLFCWTVAWREKETNFSWCLNSDLKTFPQENPGE